MNKIIAREVNPAAVDFSFYFDDDGLKSSSGENCACYIIPANRRHYSGFNMDEYREIENDAENLIDEYNGGEYPISSVLEGIGYRGKLLKNTKALHKLKEWTKTADTNNTDDIAEFLTITTGEQWESRSFCGYSQGDYCEVVYCTAHYSEEHITEIGKFWLGCGTEFSIDDCYGYFITDEIRWKEGEPLRNALADAYGCKPEELEIYLYSGEHTVTDYELMREGA